MSREFPKNNPPQNTSPEVPLPTIGRVVYFFERAGALEEMAFVCDVLGGIGGRQVNLLVVGHDGTPNSVHYVPHAADREADNPGMFWDWMPYQKGQAAKTEAIQQELGKLQASAPSLVDGKR